MFERLDWLPLDKRFILKKAVFMYKIFNDILPNCLTSFFTFVNNYSPMTLRSESSVNFLNHRPRIECYKKSILYSGCIIWNELPHDIKTAPSIIAFKRLSRNYFQGLA